MGATGTVRALTLALVLSLPFAAASSFAGCRVEYVGGWNGACVAERALVNVPPMSVGVGVDARPFHGLVSLYLFARMVFPGWTLTLEGHRYTLLDGSSGTGMAIGVWASW